MWSDSARRMVVGLACLIGSAAPAAAQQAVSFNVGYFAVRGEDARVSRDVLVENRRVLTFDVGKFSNVTFGGEYLVTLNEYIEAGFGVGYYQRVVPSYYTDYTADDLTEIEQDLKLRIIPLTATVRFLPLGQLNPIQPYIGGGLGVFRWRYSETGDFIDETTFEVFRDNYVADDTDVGGVVVAGARFVVSPALAVGGEFRYQAAKGETGGANAGFLADEIDLGGYTGLFTLAVKF